MSEELSYEKRPTEAQLGRIEYLGDPGVWEGLTKAQARVLIGVLEMIREVEKASPRECDRCGLVSNQSGMANHYRAKHPGQAAPTWQNGARNHQLRERVIGAVRDAFERTRVVA